MACDASTESHRPPSAGVRGTLTRSMRPTLAGSLILVAAAGCTGGSTPRTTDDGGSFNTPTAQLQTAAAPVEPAALDPGLLPGLDTGMRVTEPAAGGGRASYQTWPVVTGAPVLNAAMFATAQGFTRAASAAGTVSEHTLGWSLVAVDPAVAGIRQTSTVRTGSGARESTAVTWYDTATRTTHPSLDLINDADRPHLRRQVAELVMARTRLTEDAARDAITDDRLTALSFVRDTGDLLVELDPNVPGLNRKHTVAVQESVASQWLSNLGRAALDATRQPRAMSLPGVEDASDSSTTAAPGKVPGGSVNCLRTRCVALVFAGGPTSASRSVLASLASAKIPASFFPTGEQAEMFPDIVAQQIAAGHLVGNGTGQYRRLDLLDASARSEQVAAGREALQQVGPTSSWLLAPFGASGRSVVAAAGGPVLLPSTDSRDWVTNATPAAISARVASQVRPGSTVLLHDGLPGTAQAIPGVVKQLRAKGYRFVRVDQIMSGRKPVAGRSYVLGTAAR